MVKEAVKENLNKLLSLLNSARTLATLVVR